MDMDNMNNMNNMDNMNNMGGMNNMNNMNNGYYGPYNKKPKQKSNLALGMVLGVLIGCVLTMGLVCVAVFGVLESGMIKLSAGKIYVQPLDVTDEDGIGSAIEKKLNSLDSLMDYFYFDDVDKTKATDAIFKAYLSAYGDKYTVYYTPDEYESIKESTSGTFCGIGAVCQQAEDGTVLVVEPYDYAPAYKAGVRAGDKIKTVDGKDITTMSLDGAISMIKGEKGTKVELGIIRDGQNITISVVRDDIIVKSVEYEMMENSIGYIVIAQFDTATTQQFKNAVEALQNQGAKSFVLDVRSNPGGVLGGVIDIVDVIVGKGLVVYTEDNKGERKEYNATTDNEINVPIAVLVNGNSASAAEIFAGALQDYDKAEIIGTQTFGKGIVQTIMPLSDGSAVKFTVSKYFTPKGQDIHGKGVTPDQVVDLPENATSDVQLEAAIKYLKEKMQ